MKYRLLPILSSIFMLAGCAGVSGEFECNETTTDRCMTMDQANQKARLKTEASKGKQGAAALPGRVDLPPQVSRSITTLPVFTSEIRSRENTPARHVTQNRMFAGSSAKPAVSTPVLTVMPMATDSSFCSQQRCNNFSETRPQRSAEAMANLWVAPWVDSNDVFHQPGRVSFVVEGSRWLLP